MTLTKLESFKGNFKKYISVLCLFAFLLSFVITLVGLASNMPDSDTFFIVRTGEWIVENKEVPTINPFIMYEDCETIIQQWLYDVIAYLTYNSFGYVGLFIFVSICLMFSVIAMERMISINTNNKNLKLLLLAAFVWIFKSWSVVRPTSISFTLLVLTVTIVDNYRHGKKQWMIALLPLISLLLVNVHASMWPIMFLLMLPFICPNVVQLFVNFKGYCKEWIKQWWKMLAVIPVMILVGFLNPNGIKGMGYVFISYGLAGQVNIMELQPHTFASFAGAAIIIGVVFFSLYLYIKKFKFDSAYVYMYLGTFILSILHIRNTWFIFFGIYPICILTIKELIKNHQYFIDPIKPKTKIIVKVLAVLLICATVIITASTYTFYVFDAEFSPLLAANYLDQFENKDDIVLYTSFNNGAYMEFRHYKAFMDARPELFSEKITNKHDILTEWLSANTKLLDTSKFIEKYQFTHMIVERNTLMHATLSNSDLYEETIVGNGYILYELKSWQGDSMLVH